ncbi:MAG: hypothetical protein IJ777_04550 [Clostridia bacterium]|nr:hypothetical protein [Clostridia bacterium]
MAEQSEKIKQEKNGTKKVATGTTNKTVQKRSSSMAGKKQTTTKKNQEKLKTEKKATTTTQKKTKQSDKTEKTVKKQVTKAKSNHKTKQKEKNATAVVEQKNMQEMQEAIVEEMKSHQKMSEEEKMKINTRIFEEVCFAVATMLYLNFIILGFINIETGVFLTDLKVFGIAVLVIAIGMLEYAYRKESGKYCIHGIEMVLLALTTISLLFVTLILEPKFIAIAALMSFLFAIYYIAKSITIYYKMKKQYTIDNMKKIIKK